MSKKSLLGTFLWLSCLLCLVSCVEQGANISINNDIKELQTGDFDTRQRAASRLGESSDERAVEPLIAALSDESWAIRGSAVAGLGRLYVQSESIKAKGTDRIINPMIGLLVAEEPGLRKRVVTTLGWLRDKRAIAPLRKLNETEQNESVRNEIVVVLGVLGDTDSVLPFIETLQKAGDSWKRYDAASALGKIGDKRAYEPLIQALNDPAPQVRRSVAMALGRLGDDRAIDPLLEHLKDTDPDARYRTIEALVALKAKRAIPNLEWVAKNDTGSGNGEKLNKFAEEAIKKLK